MIVESRIISDEWLNKLVDYLSTKPFTFEYQEKKRVLVCLNNSQEKLIQIRLSLPSKYVIESKKIQHVDFQNHVILMVRSGIAAIGLFENYNNLDHKVFRSYMVRQKQGISQIKYLNTKGKSRAGSRVRLQESLLFFEGINTRLNDYFETYRIDHICLSCTETLIPYLFGSKISSPFEKNDTRIWKIPKHVQNPTYESMLATNEFLMKHELHVFEKGLDLIKKYDAFLITDQISPTDDDNW